MNCGNCGGAMDLHSTRGDFFCRYCGSFGELEQIVDARGRDRGGRMRQASDPWRPDRVASRPLMNRAHGDEHSAGAKPGDLLGTLVDLLLK